MSKKDLFKNVTPIEKGNVPDQEKTGKKEIGITANKFRNVFCNLFLKLEDPELKISIDGKKYIKASDVIDGKASDKEAILFVKTYDHSTSNSFSDNHIFHYWRRKAQLQIAAVSAPALSQEKIPTVDGLTQTELENQLLNNVFIEETGIALALFPLRYKLPAKCSSKNAKIIKRQAENVSILKFKNHVKKVFKDGDLENELSIETAKLADLENESSKLADEESAKEKLRKNNPKGLLLDTEKLQ
jgi:hypothetical protein